MATVIKLAESSSNISKLSIAVTKSCDRTNQYRHVYNLQGIFFHNQDVFIFNSFAQYFTNSFISFNFKFIDDGIHNNFS